MQKNTFLTVLQKILLLMILAINPPLPAAEEPSPTDAAETSVSFLAFLAQTVWSSGGQVVTKISQGFVFSCIGGGGLYTYYQILPDLSSRLSSGSIGRMFQPNRWEQRFSESKNYLQGSWQTIIGTCALYHIAVSTLCCLINWGPTWWSRNLLVFLVNGFLGGSLYYFEILRRNDILLKVIPGLSLMTYLWFEYGFFAVLTMAMTFKMLQHSSHHNGMTKQ